MRLTSGNVYLKVDSGFGAGGSGVDGMLFMDNKIVDAIFGPGLLVIVIV